MDQSELVQQLRKEFQQAESEWGAALDDEKMAIAKGDDRQEWLKYVEVSTLRVAPLLHRWRPTNTGACCFPCPVLKDKRERALRRYEAVFRMPPVRLVNAAQAAGKAITAFSDAVLVGARLPLFYG